MPQSADPDHDQRQKVLLKEFFEAFFLCFFPTWAARFGEASRCHAWFFVSEDVGSMTSPRCPQAQEQETGALTWLATIAAVSWILVSMGAWLIGSAQRIHHRALCKPEPFDGLDELRQ